MVASHLNKRKKNPFKVNVDLHGKVDDFIAGTSIILEEGKKLSNSTFGLSYRHLLNGDQNKNFFVASSFENKFKKFKVGAVAAFYPNTTVAALYEKDNLLSSTENNKQSFALAVSQRFSNNTAIVSKVDMQKNLSLAYETRLSQNLFINVSTDYDFNQMKGSGAKFGFTYEVGK